MDRGRRSLETFAGIHTITKVKARFLIFAGFFPSVAVAQKTLPVSTINADAEVLELESMAFEEYILAWNAVGESDDEPYERA